MTRTAAIAFAAAALIAGTTTAAPTGINLTKAYGPVAIVIASDTVDEKAVATNWCRAKGHGNAVDTVFVALRKFPGSQPGGKAYYRLINCLMVPING